MKQPLIPLLFAGALLAAPPIHAELPDPARFSVRLELGDVAQARQWLDEGLDPMTGFLSAGEALASLPGMRREVEVKAGPVRTVLSRVKRALGAP